MSDAILAKDLPEATARESEQIGRSIEAILPEGTDYVILARVPGSACPSIKSASHLRFISNIDCYGVVIEMLASLADQLSTKKCPHETEETGVEDPTVLIQHDYKPN